MLTPLVPALGRKRLKNLYEFKANLVYRNQENQGYTEKPCLKNQKKERKKRKHLLVMSQLPSALHPGPPMAQRTGIQTNL